MYMYMLLLLLLLLLLSCCCCVHVLVMFMHAICAGCCCELTLTDPHLHSPDARRQTPPLAAGDSPSCATRHLCAAAFLLSPQEAGRGSARAASLEAARCAHILAH